MAEISIADGIERSSSSNLLEGGADPVLFVQMSTHVNVAESVHAVHMPTSNEDLGVCGILLASAMLLMLIYCCSLCVEWPKCKSDVYSAYVGSSAVLQNIFITFLIPDTLKVAELFHRGPSYAGMVAAVSFLGTGVGSFLAQTGKMELPDCTSTVNLFTFGVMLSNAAFAMELELGTLAASDKYLNSSLLLLFRGVGGTISGICFVLCHPIFLELGRESERFHRGSRITVYFLTGLGLGPMIVPVANRLSSGLSTSSFLVTSMFALHFCVGLLLSWGDFGQLRSSSAATAESPASSGTSRFYRIIVGCLLVEGTRTFVTGGLEIGNSIILEALMCWDTAQAGAVIGVPILMTPLVLRLVRALEGAFSTTVLIRALLLQALLSCLLMFNFRSGFQGFTMATEAGCTAGRAWQGIILLLGASIVFPSATAAQALVMGLLYKTAASAGKDSMFGVRGCAFAISLIGSIFKFLGQWTTPIVISKAGQNVFAIEQIVLLSVFLLISEMMLPDPRSKEEAGAETCEDE
ncbi:unnamed protein product [Symbiodinium natans]|uniref:Uncharacterized protein n=1 Tax=Symbiodinium natans TaxID=878477 RepID=A0A812HAN3_9DINO|nr:unnamed protein product [Symbiodinium natans]